MISRRWTPCILVNNIRNYTFITCYTFVMHRSYMRLRVCEGLISSGWLQSFYPDRMRPPHVFQFSFILLWCYVLSKDGRLLVYEHTQGSYWSNSLDFLMENKSICQQQKPRKQPWSAAIQQTNIHPFILHSGHHTDSSVTLSLWSSDCASLCLFPPLCPTKEHWWKARWVNFAYETF